LTQAVVFCPILAGALERNNLKTGDVNKPQVPNSGKVYSHSNRYSVSAYLVTPWPKSVYL